VPSRCCCLLLQLQLQFDNTARAIEGGNKNDLLAALANSVFLVPRGKVSWFAVCWSPCPPLWQGKP
jgi:hypothetical protein